MHDSKNILIVINGICGSDSKIVMLDRAFGDDFRTRSVMGRLWDDDFRDLGYPPKSYRGQDAGFDSGSSS